MLGAAAVDLPTPSADPARVRNLTHQILRAREFQPPRRTLLQAAWHWLATELDRVLNKVFGVGSLGYNWGAVVVVAVVVAVVIVLVVIAATRRVRRGRSVRRVTVVLRGQGPSRPPAEWRAEAGAHEAAGRWRDALRCRYRALVAELVGRGLVEEIPGRTTGEYRRQVNVVAPGAGPAFDGATDLFEQAWYGDHPTGREEQERFEDLARRVLAPVGGGRGWSLSSDPRE